ncbi:helix-turn-helix domain-containing protein [uncultured Chitinophaga sp.]|jgi:Transcriptional regulator containing an amidase domain and an AraC-type DNA-binding HTH domain|uniref:GlxA family transcriptional regulator n=1 Tax=uncultured Chitinophaga sp. TaxID=339340 RepID=UPI0026254209|nr:helix-turn-helix domain-containing protein [uncultured Chitinophaga sp.]
MNQGRKIPGSQRKKKQVVIVVVSRDMLLTFTGPRDVFVSANTILRELGQPEGYEVEVVAATPDKTVDAGAGMRIVCQHTAMDIRTPVDTLIIAGNDSRENSQPALQEFYEWLSARNERNTRRIASVCGGAFPLAIAGILNGRKATTHWQNAEKLQRAHPEVEVNSDPMYTRDGHVYTAAGGSSGIDLALALVEQDYGKEVAGRVAKRIVFYLNRPGYQAQFGNLLPAYGSQHIAEKIQSWLSDHLHEKLDVGQLAAFLHMSTRNFTRVFSKETGMPPAKFIEKLRVEAARKYLEDTDLSIERIAGLCGLGGLVSMRRTFLRHLMVTPSDYRRSFRTAWKEFTVNNHLL